MPIGSGTGPRIGVQHRHWRTLADVVLGLRRRAGRAGGSGLARPDIRRSTSLGMVTRPSVRPLDRGSTIAASTAFRSAQMPAANEAGGLAMTASARRAEALPSRPWFIA
jgi:hypothetical protein